jgi:hypothetical protein
MGQYATINEQQIKFSGLLPICAKECYIDINNVVRLTHRDVEGIVAQMWAHIYDKKDAINITDWATESSIRHINLNHVRHYRKDIDTLIILLEWLDNNGEEDDLVFA